jgi:hypothetical protein
MESRVRDAEFYCKKNRRTNCIGLDANELHSLQVDVPIPQTGNMINDLDISRNEYTPASHQAKKLET